LPGFYLRARARVLRDRPLLLNNAFDRLIDAANHLVRQIVTEHLMTLRLSSVETLRLGRDLHGRFPQLLEHIDDARLREMLQRIDATPDSVSRSGARDWANFRDRMHLIADFFRVYQERRYLFDAPFTNEQTAQLKNGVRPRAPL
jgi:hypothetical protein